MDAIVNVSPDWGIGCNNRLLTFLREDMRRFRELTLEKTVILGRKTLETFPEGKPLKHRRNLILSRNTQFSVPDAEVFHDLSALLAHLRTLPREEICVIGGESVYRALLPYCDRALVTKNDCALPADAFFPNLDALPEWELRASSPVFSDGGVRYQFIDYVNCAPKAF